MPILLIILLFSTVAGGGYFYYTDTQSTIAQLRENNAQLKIAVETNEQTIDNMQELWSLYKKPRLVLNCLREVNNNHKEKTKVFGKNHRQCRISSINSSLVDSNT